MILTTLNFPDVIPELAQSSRLYLLTYKKEFNSGYIGTFMIIKNFVYLPPLY
jgi:hypothetical protein